MHLKQGNICREGDVVPGCRQKCLQKYMLSVRKRTSERLKKNKKQEEGYDSKGHV